MEEVCLLEVYLWCVVVSVSTVEPCRSVSVVVGRACRAEQTRGVRKGLYL